MQARDLVSSGQLAANYGVKMLGYGPPGSGKTPVITSAPRPVMLSVEPGMLSMRGTNIPTYQATKWAQIKEFFDWVLGSNEAKAFDTVCVDSVSHVCETHVRDNPGKHSHGLKVYGVMAEDVYGYLYKFYELRQKHVYLIAKQEIMRTDAGTFIRPYFPGQALPIAVPHLYDLIAQLDHHSIPGHGVARAFRCFGGFGVSCRDRSGRLAEFEPPDLSAMFAKCMA